MDKYPDQFTDNTTLITEQAVGLSGQQALRGLGEKGFEVHYGLTRQYAEQIITMAREPAICEYCPNDSGQRFADMQAVADWLAKGRAVYLLIKIDADRRSLAGYGWAGPSTSRHVPGSETTFAVRIGESGQGQGLAAPFCQVVLQASAKLHKADKVWLETWQSNGAAVHIYHKIGFEDVVSHEDTRITLSGETIADRRIYMRLPDELLIS